MSDSYTKWVAAKGFPTGMSAEELMVEDGVEFTLDEMKWLDCFIAAWNMLSDMYSIELREAAKV